MTCLSSATEPPAQFSSTSMRPKAACVSRTICATLSSLVTSVRMKRAAGPASVGARLAQRLVDLGNDHLRALGCEQARRGAADAGSAAGDDGDLVCETVHAVVLPVWLRLKDIGGESARR